MRGPDMQDQARVSRLQWRCRRGMKELDVLLERFLHGQRQPLAAGRWPELETLLEAEDDLLWDWLQNPAAEQAAPWRPLLERIRRG
jgi:antitoxin CptB